METVLITGASDGIGCALAIRCASSGARVFGIGRRAFPATLQNSIAPTDYLSLDLQRDDCAAVVSAFLDTRQATRLDALVHNAAVGWYGAPAQQNSASIDELLRVNLYAPIALTHALLPRLRVAHGVVAFVSSVHSALPTPDFAVYGATKAGLDAFARNLRIEERGAVAVVVVWPGPTRTQMHARSGVPEECIHSRRYAAPEAVANQVMTAICSRQSRVVGMTNRIVRWAATHFEASLDAMLIARARRRAAQQPRKAP